MKPVNEYFKLLGVDSSATPEGLRKAYRDLVKEWHPDRYLHNPRLHRMAQEKLQQINEAYDHLEPIISNSKNRSSQTAKESKPHVSAAHRQGGTASIRTGDVPPIRSRNQHVAHARTNYSSLLWRLTLQTVKDPWLIAAFILMLALGVVFDWFYQPN